MKARITFGLAATILALTACKTAPSPVGPDCTPMVAKVQLLCWYGGRGAPLSECEAHLEEPQGCGIASEAVDFFNSGLDLSGIYHIPGQDDRSRWVQFSVYRDQTGKVGRKYFSEGQEFLIAEKRFGIEN